ncbi:hypothetical protein THAOC_04199 [Thalassiosira oceanica]|uniref:Uncharacterized protein n=1 Tax=Thalassiosira oceanica TaxID=159749 RepID=K0T9E9_THAOC|nr:hypothetical protein THAOC_04199 [Thalassiosira oceanica]|eukprot:EJK74140.1 hypothetical protein THAOC_04199 [Thalassiosira oceanica]
MNERDTSTLRAASVERPTELRRRKTNGAPAGGGREEEDTPYDGAASTKTTAASPRQGLATSKAWRLDPREAWSWGRCGVGVAGAGAGAVGVSLGWAVEDPTHSCVRYKWERKIRMHRGTDRVQK